MELYWLFLNNEAITGVLCKYGATNEQVKQRAIQVHQIAPIDGLKTIEEREFAILRSNVVKG